MISDQILSGYLRDFQTQQGLENADEPELFSKFALFCVICKQTGNPKSLDDLDTDGGQDTGIDGIAVLVNDRLVNDKEDIDYFRDSGRLEVEFLFIQAKSSPKFDSGEIGKFLFGVQNFFESAPKVASSPIISSFRDVKDYVYQNSIHLKRAPVCRLFYATTGKWTNEPFLVGRIEHEVEKLKKTGLFFDVRFTPLDADKVKATYRELRHRVEKEVLFEKHTILPKIDRAEEAYLGILPSSEFLKLITDDDGDIQKSLFYDNVRDFQGSNPVNSEIAATLVDQKVSGGFAILNNGVTIVARAIGKVGASFRVSDYQIVNGCQTSHVLHYNRDQIGPGVYVPVKLIVTSDSDLMNHIIKATNRQTEVKLEAFESLSPFHRSLEEFYASFKDPDQRLYYERRSKQYANTPIKPTSIITLAAQAKCYLGMFLNEPHSTHRYYGEILESYRDRLFQDDHALFPYYVAGLALSRLEGFFRAGDVAKHLRRFRHHLLLLFRLSVGGPDPAPMHGKKSIEYSRNLCDVLWNHASALAAFQKCVDSLTRALEDFHGPQNQADRLRMFTNRLMPGERQRPRGTVSAWYPDRGFGFVTAEDGSGIFVHFTAIRESSEKRLWAGDEVEFDVVQAPKGLQARNLSVLHKD